MDLQYGQFLISDDEELLNLATVKGFLARSYWASKRSEDRIERSINNSVCFVPEFRSSSIITRSSKVLCSPNKG